MEQVPKMPSPLKPLQVSPWQVLPLILLCVVTAVALAELYLPFKGQFAEPWLAPAWVHTALALLVVGLVAKRRELGEVFGKAPLVAYLPAVLVLFGAGLLVIVSRQFGSATPRPTAVTPWAWLFWVPIVEELVFRVGLGTAFRRIGRSVVWGSWFAALAFALVHADPTIEHLRLGQLGLPLGPFLLGLACEALYVKTGRILPSMTLHAACNATALVFAFGDERWHNWLGFLYS